MGVDINSLEVKVNTTGLDNLDKSQQNAGRSAEWLEKRAAILARVEKQHAEAAAEAAKSSTRLAEEQKKAAATADTLADAQKRATQETKNKSNADKELGVSTASSARGAVALGAAIAASVVSVGLAVKGAIDLADSYNDLAAKTGLSIKAIAEWEVAARQNGATTADMAQAIKGLARYTKTHDDALSKAGITATDVDGKLMQLAEVFKDLPEGELKAQLATTAFGRSGEALIPVLSQGSEKLLEAREKARLYAEQMAILSPKADELNDKLTELSLEFKTLAAVVAGPVAVALGGLIGQMLEGIRISGSFSGGIGLMLKTISSNAGLGLSVVDKQLADVKGKLDDIQKTGRAPLFGKNSTELKEQQADLLKQREFLQFKQRQEALQVGGGSAYSNEDRGSVARAKAEAEAAATKKAKAIIDASNKKTVSGGGNNGEEASQLAYDLSQIRKSADEEIQIERNKEQILSAERSARKVDDEEYYAAKAESIQKIADIQEAASVEAIARMKQESLTGKDAINMSRKIAEEESKINQIRQTAATQLTINEIQAADAVDKLAKSLDVARASAQAYLDTLERQNAATLAGIGMGSKYRAELAQINAVEMRMLQERQRLDEQRTRGDLKVGEYEARLAIIEEYGAKEIVIVKRQQKEMDEVRKDGNKGAYEALKNYTDMVEDQAKQWEDATTKAFGGMEDALAEFVSTGKADFKSLADSIVKDIARIMIRQYVTGPLAGAMGGGGVGGGVLGWLFGGGNSAPVETAAANAMGGDVLGNLIGLKGFAEGTDYVPNDMVAKIHQGEAVLTKSENQKRRAANDGNGSVTNVINLHMPQGTPAESRRAAGQGAREAMAAMTGAGRYR